MAGLGIQHSIDNLIDTTGAMVTARDLFQSRYREYVQKSNLAKELAVQTNQPEQLQEGLEIPKVKSIKDRLNQTSRIAGHESYLDNSLDTLTNQSLKQWTDVTNEFKATIAKGKAELARRQKLQEKATAVPHRPDEPIERGMNVD